MTSILKVSEIQDPTNSNTALTIDATGNVNIPGHVVQVAYAQDLAVTVAQVTSSTTFIDITGMSVTITPLFSTSKLLVFARLHTWVSGGTSPYMVTTLARDGVNMSSSSYSQGYTQGDIYVGNPISMTAFANANSTTATTFKAQMRLGGGGASSCQTDNADKVLYVMEIAQ